MKTYPEIYREAADTLERVGWCKAAYATRYGEPVEPGEPDFRNECVDGYCLMGAVMKAAECYSVETDDLLDLTREIANTLRIDIYSPDDDLNVPAWNDEQDGPDAPIAILRATAARLE